jgi:hypothetical protein
MLSPSTLYHLSGTAVLLHLNIFCLFLALACSSILAVFCPFRMHLKSLSSNIGSVGNWAIFSLFFLAHHFLSMVMSPGPPFFFSSHYPARLNATRAFASSPI